MPDRMIDSRMNAVLMLRLSFVLSLSALLASLAGGCAASHHPTVQGRLGTPASSDDMLRVINEPGPIVFEKVLAAHWTVIRSGLINLDHPNAVAANLEDGDEPIEIYFYVLRHPKFGTFIVDSGVESGFRTPESSQHVSWLVGWAMKADQVDVQITTAEWLAAQPEPLAGVFITHLHMDHVMGLPDVPTGTPVYAGPGETEASQVLNAFTRGTIDRMLSTTSALNEWPFAEDPASRFAGVLDIFGDGSVWAIHVPGHTPGSTAFVVRTPQGPHLLVGDATHTRWGWENGVEPGSFSHNPPQSAVSLKTLLDLSAQVPEMKVHPGHQSLEDDSLASGF
ncbi:MAG TPA: MBL fold metallo-hydrolase [Myxococcales bacterium]|nr:MBL fold metallo-hydrolase [Myxococcales bacterium]